jgi:hypothetical protein
MPRGDPDCMFSPRRGVLVALLIGSIVGGTASATIISASSRGDDSAAHIAHVPQPGAQPSWSGT